MPQGSPAVLKFFLWGTPKFSFPGYPAGSEKKILPSGSEKKLCIWVREDNFKGQIPSQCLRIRIDVWAISHSRCVSHTTAIRVGNR
ncbi:hypothetical protein HRbin15_02314 [bacterium HR15]|nr:hypothetical protein HRbin15_02314 [bacterium HR15]